LRYFTYISDAKVDMLLPQIRTGKKQTIAAELGFNAALLSGKIRAEAAMLDTRVARLLAVEKYIRANEAFDKSGTQGWLERIGARSFSILLEGGALLWLCEEGDCLLAGSVSHLAGAAPIQGGSPFSELAGIMALVSRAAPGVLPYFDGSDAWPHAESMRADFVWLRNLIAYVRETCERRGQPPQEIGFLARRLVANEHLVLASPLYVELRS